MKPRDLAALALSCLLLVPSLTAIESDVYCGEPFGEALHDIMASGGIPISHEMCAATPLRRTDVFRFPDGRLVAVTSSTRKLGEPFGIEALRLAPSAASKLNKRLPPQMSIKLPPRSAA